MPKNIGIFCSSKIKPSKSYLQMIYDIVSWLEFNKFNLVIGGESCGLMKSFSKIAYKKKIRIFGIVSYNFQNELEKNNYITDLIITQNLEERKKQFIARSDCFIFLPGGIGTLNELLDLIVKRENKEISKNIFLISDTFWKPFFEYLNYLIKNKMMKKKLIINNVNFLDLKKLKKMRSKDV
tara:strand:- start:1778 stop:2320 length:543 start_codon:yes stop_codon:yes gene_type:complete